MKSSTPLQKLIHHHDISFRFIRNDFHRGFLCVYTLSPPSHPPKIRFTWTVWLAEELKSVGKYAEYAAWSSLLGRPELDIW